MARCVADLKGARGRKAEKGGVAVPASGPPRSDHGSFSRGERPRNASAHRGRSPRPHQAALGARKLVRPYDHSALLRLSPPHVVSDRPVPDADSPPYSLRIATIGSTRLA